MPKILLGCPESVEDENVVSGRIWATGLLDRVGYMPVAVPPDAVAEQLRVTSHAGGQFDAVVFADPQISSNSLEPDLRRAAAVRNLHEHLAFGGGARARTIPIVILTFLAMSDGGFCSCPPTVMERSKIAELRWAAFAEPPDTDLCPIIEREILAWKRDLLGELDRVGFAVTLDHAGTFQVSHALVRRRTESGMLVDEASPARLRSEGVLLVSDDFLRISRPMRELQALLRTYREIATRRRVKPESLFQEFFQTHPRLLAPENIEEMWPRLRLPPSGPEQRYLEPDFILRVGSGTHIASRLRVIDLKLPDVGLMAGPRTHRGLSMGLRRGIDQMMDYQRALERLGPEELCARFGVQKPTARLALIIGGRDPAEESALGDRLLNQYGARVEVMTYDHVLDTEARRLAAHLRVAP